MIKSEKQIYIEETQVKPNKAAVILLMFVLGIIVICWAVAEAGIFRIDRVTMRVGAGISAAVVITPIIIVTADKRQYSNPITKYYMLAACFIYTLTTTTLLVVHTQLMLLLPIFFAMLYRSKNIGKLAITASMLCTVFAPVLAYLLGTWDVEMLAGQIHVATGGIVEITGAVYETAWWGVRDILLYFMLPKAMMVVPCALLMFRVIAINSDHVKSEILLNHIDNRDRLTGLYSQNQYRDYCSFHGKKGTVGVVSFDVNGLRKVNDSHGREWGDILLKKCAQSIASVCDDISSFGFRVGGDEFIMVVEGASKDDMVSRMTDWRTGLRNITYQSEMEGSEIQCVMATGYAVGDFSDFNAVASQADTAMYRNKALMKSERMLSSVCRWRTGQK